MNPDSEIPIIQAKSPSQKDTRIQYLKDSNKQLATKEQNVKASTVKSNVENISTHKPEPKEQRVIHPTNNHRINEPRHRNSNYEENARNNPTHHPRKAGSKSYHPGDYSDPPIYREAAPTERSYGYNDYRQRYLNHPNNYYGEDEDDEDDDDYDYFHRERYSPRYPQPNRYVYSQNTPRYPESDSYPYSKVISVNNHNLNGERPQRPDIPQRPNVYSSPDGSRNQHSIDYQNENTKYWRPSENFRKPNENHKDYRDSAEHSRHNENNSEKYKTGNPETSFYDSDAKNISPDYNQNYKSNDPDNANSEKYHNERTYNKNEESDDATYSNSKNPDNLNNQDSAANYENYKDHTTKQPIRYNEFPRNVKAEEPTSENTKISEDSGNYDSRESYPKGPRLEGPRNSGKLIYYDSNQGFKKPETEYTKVIFPEKSRAEDVRISDDSRDPRHRSPYLTPIVEDSRILNAPKYEDSRNQEYEKPVIQYPVVVNPEIPNTDGVKISDDSTYHDSERPKVDDSKISVRPGYQNSNRYSENPHIEDSKVIIPNKPETEGGKPNFNTEEIRSDYHERPIKEDTRILEDNRNIKPERPEVEYPVIINLHRPKTDNVRISEKPKYHERPEYDDSRNIQEKPPRDEIRNNEERTRYNSENNKEVPVYSDEDINNKKPRYEYPRNEDGSSYHDSRSNRENLRDENQRENREKSRYNHDTSRNKQERPIYDESRNRKPRPVVREPEVRYLENFESEDPKSLEHSRFQDSRSIPEAPIVQNHEIATKPKFEETSKSSQNKPKSEYVEDRDYRKYPETSIQPPKHPNYKNPKVKHSYNEEERTKSQIPKLLNFGRLNSEYGSEIYPKDKKSGITYHTDPVTPKYQNSEKLINVHSPDTYQLNSDGDKRGNGRYQNSKEIDHADPSEDYSKTNNENHKENDRNLENTKQRENLPRELRYLNKNQQKIQEVTKQPPHYTKYEDEKETTGTIYYTTPLSTFVDATTEENLSHLFDKEKFGDRIKPTSSTKQNKVPDNFKSQEVSIAEIPQKSKTHPGNTFIIPFVMYKGRSNTKRSNSSNIASFNNEDQGKESNLHYSPTSHSDSDILEQSRQNANQQYSSEQSHSPRSHHKDKASELLTISTPLTTPYTYVEPIESTTEILSDTTTRRYRKRKPKRRRRKHGRRRRPKRPRVQNTTISEDQTQILQAYSESPLTGVDQTTLYVTTANYDTTLKQFATENINYNEKYDRLSSLKVRDITTIFPIELPNQETHSDNRFVNRPEKQNTYSTAQEYDERQPSYRDRSHFKTRVTSNHTSQSFTPAITTQKPFTYEKVEDVTTTESLTTSRPIRTRNRATRQKYKKRPRLFNFGRPKSNEQISLTTSLPSTHQESS
ncbi:protein PFC0760c-like [Centruroides sculpturatus]|uniref:protein PFC0760c-like n=1 Tax=Centruroides sculpturatus TaxID=218467 RepID=UPI000C6E1D4E|nr:protein PFC0760c-like [Centruroides sculpturatus]